MKKNPKKSKYITVVTQPTSYTKYYEKTILLINITKFYYNKLVVFDGTSCI
jgi:hypothetical protein